MTTTDDPRFHLLGKYRTPRFQHGGTITDEARGGVVIVGLTDAPIPWRIGKRGRAKSLVLFGDLVKAVRRESNQAVSYWWGVSGQTVTKWRKALGVDVSTEGTSKLHRDDMEAHGEDLRAKIVHSDPARRGTGRGSLIPVTSAAVFFLQMVQKDDYKRSILNSGL